MRKITSALAFVVTLALPISGQSKPAAGSQIPAPPTEPHTGIVISSFDEFSGYTTTALNIVTIPGFEFRAFWLNKGKHATRPISVSLTFQHKSESWEFLECHFTNFLIDGRPLATPDATHNGSVGTGYVLEFIHISMPTTTFLRFVNAKEAKVKICNDVIEFDEDNMVSLRDFASRMGRQSGQ